MQQECGFGDLFLWHKVQRMFLFTCAELAWCISGLVFLFFFLLHPPPSFFFILPGQYSLVLTGDETGAGEEQ